jgi:hypothetical protein
MTPLTAREAYIRTLESIGYMMGGSPDIMCDINAAIELGRLCIFRYAPISQFMHYQLLSLGYSVEWDNEHHGYIISWSDPDKGGEMHVTSR